MSRRSIRKVIATARRESYKALKYHIKGMQWVDNVTVDTHLTIFSNDYMMYFWSHLATACTALRPLEADEPCATPREVSVRLTGKVHPVAGCMKISMPHSVFFLKTYDGRLSCGPHYLGNTVLNIRTEDIAELIAAYDNEIGRCPSVVTGAISECNAEAVALDIALTTARTIAEDIIRQEGIDIEADEAGRGRVHYTITLQRNPVVDTDFWASTVDLKKRLLRAIRHLRHKEYKLYRQGIPKVRTG